MSKYDRGFARPDELGKVMLKKSEFGYLDLVWYTKSDYKPYLVTVNHDNPIPDKVLLSIKWGLKCPAWRVDFTNLEEIRRCNLVTGVTDTFTYKGFTTAVMLELEKKTGKHLWDHQTQQDGTGEEGRPEGPPPPPTTETPIGRRLSEMQYSINSSLSHAVDVDLLSWNEQYKTTAVVELKHQHAHEQYWILVENLGRLLKVRSAKVTHNGIDLEDIKLTTSDKKNFEVAGTEQLEMWMKNGGMLVPVSPYETAHSYRSATPLPYEEDNFKPVTLPLELKV
jgi:hypothetical protein